jgi:hypothetical protein
MKSDTRFKKVSIIVPNGYILYHILLNVPHQLKFMYINQKRDSQRQYATRSYKAAQIVCH